MLTIVRWFERNFSTLLLSFVLSVVVWASAVMASDPNRERTFTTIPLEIIGQAEDMLIVNKIPENVAVTLYAPESNLNLYEKYPHAMQAILDITGLESGAYTIPINVTYTLQPTRLLNVEPQLLDISIDRLVTRIDPVQIKITGKPTRGYQAGTPVLTTSRVTISGPGSLVEKVKEIRATLDISGKNENIDEAVSLQALDTNENIIEGVNISPKTVQVMEPISLLGGYRNEVVRVVTIGQIADGYRLTSIFSAPANVLLFSTDALLIDNLPGYIETKPLDLNGATKNMEVWLPLNLPESVSVIGDQNVLAQVNIAAIESSLSIQLPLEIIGLSPGLVVEGAPKLVDLILSGPLPALDALQKGDIRIVLDLTDKEAGIYQLKPLISILSKDIRAESITPDTVEVTLLVHLTSSKLKTPTPASPTRTPLPSP